MNRKELIRRVALAMRENNIRKPISSPKQVFHISDDEGNTKDFVVRKTNKDVLFTVEDIDAIIEACLFVVEEAMKRGEPISIRGFGTLGLKYRKRRATKIPGTEEWVDVDARYIPRFIFGNDLRMCAKIYELSLQDKQDTEPLPSPDFIDDEEIEGE
jgi:nucleoid DNA-binding protein